MIDALGTITALDGKYALVLMDESGCGRCHEQGGCGGNNLGKMFCSTPRTFRVLNPRNSVIGERDVRFDFKHANAELPLIAGSMPVFSKTWGRQADGSATSFDKLGFETPVSSGPYLVKKLCWIRH